MQTTRKIQISSIIEDLFGSINCGNSGCFAIRREPKFDDHLALYTQRRPLPITNLAVSLETGSGQQFVRNEADFQGCLILDGRGAKRERVRLIVMGADETLLLASDCDQLKGQIIAVADSAISAEPKLYGFKAVFGEDTEGPVSMLVYDGAEVLTELWTIETQLMRRRVSGIDMRMG